MTISRYAPHLILLGGVLTATIIIVASFAVAASAQENTITFPVAELGNCTDKAACKAYCNDSAHITECVAFAEAHGLMKKEEAEVARKFAGALQEQGGPGGCTDPQSCRAFCENIEHIEECIAFADSSGHADDDVEEGRKVAKFIKTGGQMPGGCTSRQSCEAYCGNFEHGDECLAFAERAGLEIREPDGRKVDIEQIRKVHALMKSGETPGGCTSREQCEAFCQSPDNAEQCLSFAERAGFMPQEEIARARKMMQEGGPGGCRGREACEAFCHNPENQEQCMAFAEENGMMRPEDGQRMREMRSAFEEGMQQMGPQGERGGQGGPEGHGGPGIGNCVREKITSIMTSGGVPDQGIMQGVVQECMAQTGNPGKFGGPEGFGPPMGENGQFGPPGGGGPGGPIKCGTEENPNECQQLEPPHRGGGGGPGGCTNPAECQAYCKDHQEECKNSSSPGGEGQQFGGQYPMHEGQRPQDGMGMPFNPEDAKRFMNEAEMHDIRGMMEGGMMPPRDGMGGPDGTFNAEFQKRFEGEFQNQYQQQYQQQYQNQYQGMMPPDGSSGGMMMPPPGDYSGEMMMPPPPPPDGTATQSKANIVNTMVANVLMAIFSLYGVH